MNTTLYPGIPFSPQAQLTTNIGAADTIIEVSDVSAFPPAPNLATIGTDEEGETILYTAKTETALSGCQRGVEGTAKSWTAGELIGRNFAAKDHAGLIAAVTEAYGAAEAAQDAAATAGTVAAAKQPKLTGQPGQVVGFGADGAAVAVSGWSNPNLLLNWYFPYPVNQRNIQSGVFWGTQEYGLDRWKSFDSGVTKWVEGEGIHLLPIEGYTNAIIDQRINLHSIDNGSQITASCLIDGQVAAFSTIWDYSANSELDIPLLSGSVRFQVRPLDPGNGIGTIRIWCYTPKVDGSSYLVKAAKLELGPIQTIAHQDADGNWVLNDPPDYDLQYALCSLYSPITGEWVGNQHSNPNLLDNWYFADPVNQRVQTEYAAFGYSIDRWAFIPSDADHPLRLTKNGLSFASSTTAQSYMEQFIENFEELKGKTVTFSAIGTFQGLCWLAIYSDISGSENLAVAIYPISGDGGLSVQSVTANIPDGDGGSFLRFRVVANTGSSVSLQAAKLELGPVQTLAHQDADGNWALNDPPPNKALELAKCQRYYQRIKITRYARAGYGYLSGNDGVVSIPLFCQMRANPSFNMSPPKIWVDPGDVLVSVGLFSSPIGNEAQLLVRAESPTTGFVRLRNMGDSDTIIEFSADL